MTFIVIEGGDGSGKGTHAALLSDWLREKGHDVFETSEPTKGLVGRLIRSILQNHEEIGPKALALLFTADRWEHQRAIDGALAAGKVVVCDRYDLSTYAYQSAQGVDLEWLKKAHEGIRKPDLQILLDLDSETALERLKSTDLFENLEFMKKVREKYLELNDGFVIRTESEKGETQDEIRKVVSQFLQKKS